MVVKGSKTVDGKATQAETNTWQRFAKQVVMPFVTTEKRIEDAYRAGFRAAHTIWVRKEEARKKRLEKAMIDIEQIKTARTEGNERAIR